MGFQHCGFSMLLRGGLNSYNKDNIFMELPNCRNTLKAFDERLKKILTKFKNMHAIYEKESCVEYFYIIKVD